MLLISEIYLKILWTSLQLYIDVKRNNSLSNRSTISPKKKRRKARLGKKRKTNTSVERRARNKNQLITRELFEIIEEESASSNFNYLEITQKNSKDFRPKKKTKTVKKKSKFATSGNRTNSMKYRSTLASSARGSTLLKFGTKEKQADHS